MQSKNTPNYYQKAASQFETVQFHEVLLKVRSFFLQKNFIECHTQSRLSILAACEDPTTIQTFKYHGQNWPLPQTGQMWLEYELLTKPDVAGYFCLSTSYRNEKNPKPGRHLTIFPMFEFESHGTFEDLRKLEKEFIDYMNIQNYNQIKEINYLDVCQEYNVSDINYNEEDRLYEQYGNAVMLENFPNYSSPFWNMKREGNIAKKIDVIMFGQETIGSAERSCDIEQMEREFNTISNGEYAEILYLHFGKKRVIYELESFLNLNFFPRFGGGIGMSRLIRAVSLR